MKLHALQYLLAKESNKQQRRGGIISNFTKGDTFFISSNKQVPFGVISLCSPPSCTLQKGRSSSLQFDHEENIPGRSF